MSDTEVKVRFGAETSGIEAGATKTVAQMKRTGDSMTATAADVKKLDDALTAYMSKLDPTYRAQAQLAKGIGLLDENLKAGNISAETHAAMMGKLDTAYGRAAAGLDTATKGHQKFNLATAGSLREMIVIGRELSYGDFSRLPGSLMVMMSRAGMLTTALRWLTSGMGLTTIAGVAVGAVLGVMVGKSESAARELNRLEAEFTATGRAGMVNRAALEEVLHGLRQLPGVSREAAGQIVEAFSRSRKIGGEMFAQLTGLVTDFATATGRKVPEAAKELAKSFADPLAGAKALDEELGFLTANQLLAIERFMRMGQVEQAQQVLLDALRGRIQGLNKDALTPMQDAANRVARAWDSFMGSLSNTGPIQAAKSALVGLLNDVAAAFGDVDAQIANLRERRRRLLEAQGDETGSGSWVEPFSVSELDRQIAALEAVKNAAHAASAAGKGESGGKSGATGSPSAGDDEEKVKAAMEAGAKYVTVEMQRKQIQEEINRLKEAEALATGEAKAKLQDEIKAAEQARDTLKGKGDESRVEAMRRELEELKTQQTGFLDFSKAQELRFWEGKLSTLRKGSADYSAVYREVFTLRKAIAKEDFDKEVADLRARAAQYSKAGEERVTIARQIAEKTGQAYGMESVQYKQAMKEVEQAEREHAEQMARLKEIELDATRQHLQAVRDMERQNIEFQAEQGEISARQKAESLRRLEASEYAQEMGALRQKQQLANLEVTERARINGQIEALQDKHRARMNQINKQEARDVERNWKTALSPVGSAFASTINGMISRTHSLREVVASSALGMLNSYVSMGAQMLTDWAARAAARLVITTSTAESETAVETEAALAGMVSVRTAALANISAKAAEGGAAAGASVAYWPYWGWAAAPGVAAETFATLQAYASRLAMPSAAGGWDQVPEDTIAQVHKDEMILSAPLAGFVRDSAAQGGGQAQKRDGDHYHFHVSAVDARGFERMLKRNRSALVRTIKEAHRDAALPASA